MYIYIHIHIFNNKTIINGVIRFSVEYLKKMKDFVSSLAELECEAMREENARLQNIVDNQKYSVADIEKINHEKMSCNRPLIN